jgi:putative transposase
MEVDSAVLTENRPMPRIPRRVQLAPFYHVLNRGNKRQQLFFQAADYAAFLSILSNAPQAASIRLLAFGLMPNHWHLVVWPSSIDELSAYMHWVTWTHARQWNQERGCSGLGHVYQDRFRCLPISAERHLLTVLRYVEANPVRAKLVADAADWPWSSHAVPMHAAAPQLTGWPMAKPAGWRALVNGVQDSQELEAIRGASQRGRAVDAIRSRQRLQTDSAALLECP